MGLLEKLKKNSKVSRSSILAESEFFNEVETCPTAIPALNIALSGEVDGGLSSGLHMLAGPSKHYKTSIALYLASAYLNKHKDAVLLFLDCEFGSPKEYFKSFGIDLGRVFHVPFSNLEELKFELMSQLDALEESDKVFILVDSMGSASSLKEYQDSLDGKSVADMTRAKAIKSITRLVTPHLTMKDIPMVAVSHTYAEQGSMYPRQIMSGGTGLMYSANDVWIIGRQQDKGSDGEIKGWNFIITIEKSRKVKEKSKIGIHVTYEGGISKFSGMLDLAVEAGLVSKQPAGWYIADGSDKKVREKDLLTDEWLESLLNNESFKEFVKKKYKLVV